MKIGILTFHCAANYGAVLQAYALQEFLRSLGHDVRVIDYRPDYLIEPYRAFMNRVAGHGSLSARLLGWVRACLVMPIRWRRNRKFAAFVRNRLRLHPLNLQDMSPFDAFVFGSDQIWNPWITRGIDPVFVGAFPAAAGKRLIAYAASVGDHANLKADDIRALQYAAQNFRAIGCREPSLQPFFRDHFKRATVPVLDPVLLAGRPLFDSLAVRPKETKPYLLLFQLGGIGEIADYAADLAQRLHLDLIEIVSSTESLKNRRMKQSLTVEAFLGYIKQASFVVTTSFHGTAFSILFERQFAVPCLTDARDNRIRSLLSCVDLENRMVPVDAAADIPSSIDYERVRAGLQPCRNASVAFLRESLGV